MNKRKKIFITSILVFILCISLVVGCLFISKPEMATYESIEMFYQENKDIIKIIVNDIQNLDVGKGNVYSDFYLEGKTFSFHVYNKNMEELSVNDKNIDQKFLNNIRECFKIMKEYINDKYSAEDYILSISFCNHSMYNDVIEFEIYDIDYRVGYCLLYCTNDLSDQLTTLKDNFYIEIYGNV